MYRVAREGWGSLLEDRRAERWIVAAILLVAVAIRLHHLGKEPILLAKSLQGEKSGSYLGFWLRWTGPEPFFYPNWRYDASRFSRTGSVPSNSPAVSPCSPSRSCAGRGLSPGPPSRCPGPWAARCSPPARRSRSRRG